MDKNLNDKLAIALVGVVCTAGVPIAINAFLGQGRKESEVISVVRESVYQLRELNRENQNYYDRSLTLVNEQLNDIEKSLEVVRDRQDKYCQPVSEN